MKKKNIKRILICFLINTIILSSNINNKKNSPKSNNYLNYSFNLENNINYDALEYIEYFSNYHCPDNCLDIEYLPLINIINYQKEKCNFKFDGNIDSIINQINKNTNKYIEKHSDYINPFFSKQELKTYNETKLNIDNIKKLDTDFQNKIIFINSLKVILNSMLNENNEDINEDMHKIKDLVIVFNQISYTENDNFLGRYIPEENIIIINTYNIRINSDYQNKDTKEDNFFTNYCNLFHKTLKHEINHTKQFICKCRKNKGEKDNSIIYSDNKTFLIEASAESELYYDFDNNNEKNYYSYKKERNYESLLFITSLGIEDNDITKYYNSIFSSDIKKLYKFYGANDINDYYKIYRIIYLIDNINNDPKEKDIINDPNYFYKLDLFSIFLRNMIFYTENNDNFTIEENILIFNLIKNILLDGSFKYTEVFKNNKKFFERIYNETFVKEFINLEENYIKYLSEKYNIDEENLKMLEDDLNNEIFLNSYINDLNNSKIKNLISKFPTLKNIIFSINNYSVFNYKYIREYYYNLEGKKLMLEKK